MDRGRQAKIQRHPAQFRTAFAALGTVIEIIGEGQSEPNLASELAATARAYERRWSKFLPDSEISQLNATHAWMRVSAATAALLRAARTWAITTNGAFTPLIGPLAKLWNVRAWLTAIAAGTPIEMPSSAAVKAARDATDISLLQQRDAREFRVAPPAALDLGGIAKGWIADELRDIARKSGLQRVLVSVGSSSIAANAGGKPWRIGIRALGGGGKEIIGRIKLADASLSTSGDYLQQLPTLIDGQLVHHVIDPATGYPSTSAIRQATIVAASGLEAEVASTVALVNGTLPAGMFPDAASLLVGEQGAQASDNLCWQSVADT